MTRLQLKIIKQNISEQILLKLFSFLIAVEFLLLLESLSPDSLHHLHGNDGLEGPDDGDGEVHEIVSPVAGGAGHTAQLTQERPGVGPRCRGAPVGSPYLGHVGHHVAGVGAHDGNTAPAVFHLHVGGPLEDESLAGGVDGEERCTEGREAAQVDDGPAASGDHGWQHGSGHLQHGVDVAVHQGLRAHGSVLYLQEILRVVVTHPNIISQQSHCEALGVITLTKISEI